MKAAETLHGLRLTGGCSCDMLNKVLKPSALKYMPKTVGP